VNGARDEVAHAVVRQLVQGVLLLLQEGLRVIPLLTVKLLLL
jgi:hypothetical protein